MFDQLCRSLKAALSKIIENKQNIYIRNSVVTSFLKNHTQLYELCTDYKNIPDGYYNLIKGAVQSGKSRIIHSITMRSTMVDNDNMVIVVRNYTEDYNQLHNGLSGFIDEFKKFYHVEKGEDVNEDELPPIHYMGDISRNSKTKTLLGHETCCTSLKNGGSVIICIANTDQLSKLNDCIDILKEQYQDINLRLNVIIDEVDQIMFSTGESFRPQLEYLLDHVPNNQVFGVTATTYEVFHNTGFGVKNVFVLTRPENYKDIMSIKYELIEPVNEKNYIKYNYEPLKWDPSLHSYLIDFVSKDVFVTNHPNILLLKTDRLIEKQQKQLDFMCKNVDLKNKITIISYNGESTTLYSHHLIGRGSTINIKSRDGKKLRRLCKSSTNEYHIFKKTSISEVLQYLKTHGGARKYAHIVIISYNMVGRGINIVSSDFGWHLTNMYYRPSKTTNITTILQAIRLCGIYKDKIPLTCHLEESVYKDLYTGFKLQEDYFTRLEKHKSDNMSCVDFLETQKFFISKIPKRKTVKSTTKQLFHTTSNMEEDGGMDLSQFFEGCQIVPEGVVETEVSYFDDGNVPDNMKVEGKYYPYHLMDMLHKKVNNKQRIGKMIRYLYGQDRPVSYDEFRIGSEHIGAASTFKAGYENGGHQKGQHGQCWIKLSNGYIILNPIVRDFIDKKNL